MRGRKPTPRVEQDDQAPPAVAPDCPETLDVDAREEWRRVVALLLELGTIQALDRAVLATYCAAWSDWTKARAEVAKTAAVVKSPNGFPMQNPWVSIASGAFKQMQAAIAELGLSPVARARFAAGQKKKKTQPKASPWDGLLAGAHHAN
ncbi:MAG TPA: phage terminase small subunit P27 family [Pirellulales bacterium]|nr:phage terminase small subunit P27 family [Pirellulales bacterium]